MDTCAMLGLKVIYTDLGLQLVHFSGWARAVNLWRLIIMWTIPCNCGIMNMGSQVTLWHTGDRNILLWDTVVKKYPGPRSQRERKCLAWVAWSCSEVCPDIDEFLWLGPGLPTPFSLSGFSWMSSDSSLAWTSLARLQFAPWHSLTEACFPVFGHKMILTDNSYPQFTC